MGQPTEDDNAAAHANGKGPHTPLEATLSPWIMELIQKFTLHDGTATFDRAAFASSRLP
jgi:hypothetical protein